MLVGRWEVPENKCGCIPLIWRIETTHFDSFFLSESRGIFRLHHTSLKSLKLTNVSHWA